MAGDGLSSISFWFFLCTEHSRSPRHITLPYLSASSCISICLTGLRNFSIYTAPSPKAASASLDAELKALSNSSIELTKRIPLPPPPERALISKGKPIFSASSLAFSRDSTTSQPGVTGTPALRIVFLAVSLSPSREIIFALGPINSILHFSHKDTNFAFSDKSP